MPSVKTVIHERESAILICEGERLGFEQKKMAGIQTQNLQAAARNKLVKLELWRGPDVLNYSQIVKHLNKHFTPITTSTPKVEGEPITNRRDKCRQLTQVGMEARN